MVRFVKRALVISHEPYGGAGQVEQRLIQRGISIDTHIVTHDTDRPNNAVPFPDFAGYDLVVPMGSIRSLTNKEEISSWIHTELALIREIHEAGTPMLGICFGGQLIAEALGGSVEIAPVAEIGWFKIEDGLEHANPVGPGPWLEWHHDRFVPPPDAEVLAVNENAVQLIRVNKSVGTQFHPEVDEAHVVGFLAEASEDYLAEHGIRPDDVLADVRSHEADNIEQCHNLVDWFLDEVAFGPDVP